MNSETAKAPPSALVIDDEPQIRRLLRVTLEANGYRVFDAATGQDGVAQAAQRRPDVVLLDLGLPDLDHCRDVHFSTLALGERHQSPLMIGMATMGLSWLSARRSLMLRNTPAAGDTR